MDLIMTKHAEQRIADRGIPMSAIRATVLHGEIACCSRSENVKVYRAFDMSVVLDGDKVITVYEKQVERETKTKKHKYIDRKNSNSKNNNRKRRFIVK